MRRNEQQENSRTYFFTSAAVCHPSLSKIEMDLFLVPVARQSSCRMVVRVWMWSSLLFYVPVVPLAQHPMRSKINSRQQLEDNGKQFGSTRESHSSPRTLPLALLLLEDTSVSAEDQAC